MNNQSQKTDHLTGLKIAFTCILLVLLIYAGISTAGNISTSASAGSTFPDLKPTNLFSTQSKSSNPANQGYLVTDCLPIEHESGYQDLPLLCKTDNTGRRAPEDYHACRENRVRSVPGAKHLQVISSAFLVSSFLGRQFTLVGAKPSGTS